MHNMKTKDKAGFEVIEKTIDELIDVLRRIRNNDGNTFNLSQLTAPLNKMTRKDVKFEWTPERVEAFETLRNILTSPPVLHWPVYDTPIQIHCDASDAGVGGILLQKYDFKSWKRRC